MFSNINNNTQIYLASATRPMPHTDLKNKKYDIEQITEEALETNIYGGTFIHGTQF